MGKGGISVYEIRWDMSDMRDVLRTHLRDLRRLSWYPYRGLDETHKESSNLGALIEATLFIFFNISQSEGQKIWHIELTNFIIFK